MAKTLSDQMLDKGLITEDETPEARREAARAARPAETERALPPPFDAPARGVIVSTRTRPTAKRTCVECGAVLAGGERRSDETRCTECAAAS